MIIEYLTPDHTITLKLTITYNEMKLLSKMMTYCITIPQLLIESGGFSTEEGRELGNVMEEFGSQLQLCS